MVHKRTENTKFDFTYVYTTSRVLNLSLDAKLIRYGIFFVLLYKFTRSTRVNDVVPIFQYKHHTTITLFFLFFYTNLLSKEFVLQKSRY